MHEFGYGKGKIHKVARNRAIFYMYHFLQRERERETLVLVIVFINLSFSWLPYVEYRLKFDLSTDTSTFVF